jgi:hypothetical protein
VYLSLLADVAQSLRTGSGFGMPLLDSGAAGDESDETTLAAPLAPETAGPRPVAALRAGGDQATTDLDAFFSQLGDQGGFMDFLGGAPSDPLE